MTTMQTKGGTAVMNRRREGPDALDDFPTPPWGTRALCEFLITLGIDPALYMVKEPCANRGYMVRPLAEYFGGVEASDVYDYGVGYPVEDFLFPGSHSTNADFIITNPPFNLAAQMAIKSVRNAKLGAAMFLRGNWVEGGGRYQTLFKSHAPTWQLVFSERIILSKGIVRDPDKKYWCEESQKWKKPSSATAYSWFIWDTSNQPFLNSVTKTVWIPPGTRKALEMPHDYDIPEGAI